MKILTWKCEGCKQERPDEFISTLSYPVVDMPGATRNLNYCNDKDSCYWIVKAKSKIGKI